MRRSTTTRVLWLLKGLGHGGTEHLARLCVASLDRSSFEVEVAYVLAEKDALVPAIREADVPVHPLAGPTRQGWMHRLGRLLRAGDYDVVHTHSPLPAVAARLLAPRSTAFVHTEHNVWDRYRPATRHLNALTYRRNTHVFAVSQAVAESIRLPQRGPWRQPDVRVLHHGIDHRRVRRGPEARAEGRRRLGLSDDVAVVGTVGNFTPKKDHRTLLQGFDRLLSTTPARLVLVGSGPLERELRRQVDDLGIGEHVLFTGTRDDVQQILPAFDVFTLTSVHEGLPIALLEAAAAGLPSVVTPVGGTPDIVREGVDGFFFACGDVDTLASRLGNLLGDEAMRSRMGQAAAEVASRFSIAGAVEEMQQVYRRVARWPEKASAA